MPRSFHKAKFLLFKNLISDKLLIIQKWGLTRGFFYFYFFIVFNLLHSSCEYNREPQYFSNNAAQERCETFKLFSIQLPLVSSSWSQLEYSWECAHEDPLFPLIVATSSDYAVIKLPRSARAWRWQCVCCARGLNPFLRVASTDRCDTARS